MSEDLKVTPEMIEAGARVYAAFDSRWDGSAEMLTEIFKRMWAARPTPPAPEE